MKVLIAAIAFSGSLQASTISSMDECTVALYKSNPWETSYILEGSRTEGEAARNEIRSLLTENASLKVVKDELGVVRYKLIRKEALLDRAGNDIDSCEGVYSAMQVETCTSDSARAVCETSCNLLWQGMDCR